MLAPRLCRRFALSIVFVCTTSGLSFAQEEGEQPGEKKETPPRDEDALRALKAELDRVARELVEQNREGRKDEAVASERRVREVARKIEQVARSHADRKLEQAAKELLARAEKERAGGREEVARKLEEKARELGRKHAERDAKEVEKLEQKLAQARERRNASREAGNEQEIQKRQAVVDDLKERIAAAHARGEERGRGDPAVKEGGGAESVKAVARRENENEDDDEEDEDDDDDDERGRRKDAGQRQALEKALADARAHRDEARASGNEEETAKAQSVVDELKARIASGEEERPRREEGREREAGQGLELLRKEVQGLREHIQRIEEILAKLDAVERRQ